MKTILKNLWTRLRNLFLILYTVIYFHTHKRGMVFNPRIGSWGCSYADGCAIGIWIPKEKRSKMSNTYVLQLESYYLTPFLNSFNKRLLNNLQQFHDSGPNWVGGNEIGGRIQRLTKEGLSNLWYFLLKEFVFCKVLPLPYVY